MAVFYRSAFTKDMLRELDSLKDNAEKVAANPVPEETPMYFFISREQEKAVPGWKQALNGYMAQIDTGKTMDLDASHYLHYHQSEMAAAEAKGFLQDL